MKNKLFGLLVSMLAIFTASVLFIVFSPHEEVQAQTYYSPAQLYLNSSNSIASSTTNVLSTILDCQRGKELALGFTSAFVAAGASNITFQIKKGMDHSNFEVTPAFSWVWTGSGTSVVTMATNFTLNAIPFAQVTVVSTNIALATTNSVLTYNVK